MSPTLRRGWIAFGILVLVVVFGCVAPAFFWMPAAGNSVSLPVIALPGEVLAGNVLPSFFGYDLTNTLTSLFLVDAIVIIIVLVVGNRVRSTAPDRFVPRGLTNVVEFLAEFLYNQARTIVGAKHVRAVFPVAASIFLFLLVANLVKLVPGFESVGLVACAEYNEAAAEQGDKLAPGQTGYRLTGYAVDEEGHTRPQPFMRLVNGDNNADGGFDLKERTGTRATIADTHACEEKHHWAEPPLVAAKKARGEYHEKEGEGEGDPDKFVIIPFFRGATTDLNLALALALIVVVMVQVWGVQWGGLRYFFKFVNIPALGGMGKRPLKAIDFGVGLFEILSELTRLVSLSFRLFGNIVAGGVLLVVISFMVALFLPIPIYFLELFVGAIQAYVFTVLTMIYAQQAAYHGDDEEHHGSEH